MGYFVSDRFPYAQGPAGPFSSYLGTPNLRNAGTSAASVRSGLSFYRTNENVQRNYIHRTNLGADVTVNTPLLLGGIAALGLAMFLLGGKSLPKLRARRVGRLRKRHARLGAEIRRLEA